MKSKRELKVYYLILCEGKTEFNLFAYLTKNLFKEDFDNSHVQFSNKVEIIKGGRPIVSQGVLLGVSDFHQFKSKHNAIIKKYAKQTLFYLLDNDIDDSIAIEQLILNSGHRVQFLENNSEYLLLKLAGKYPKARGDFKSLIEFRSYCKNEFKNHFNIDAQNFKDDDFALIFNKLDRASIRDSFSELFSVLTYY